MSEQEVLPAEEFQIAEYEPWRKQLEELTEHCNFVPDMTTPEGYEASKRISIDVGKILTALESERKKIKAPALERSRLIDSEHKVISGLIANLREPHKIAYKTKDDEKKREKEAFDAKIQSRIDALRTNIELAADMEEDDLGEMIKDIRRDTMEDCYHRSMEALGIRSVVLDSLDNILADKVQKRQDDEKRAKEQAELDEQRRKQEAIADEQRKAQEEIDKRQREQDERDAKAKAEEDAKEREKAAAETARQEERDRLERERQEAEEQAKRQTAVKAQQERLAEEEREREAREKPELEQLEALADVLGAFWSEACDKLVLSEEVSTDLLVTANSDVQKAVKALRGDA